MSLLTAEELLDTKYCSSDQTILGMLKEKGAPVGNVQDSSTLRYSWIRSA